MTIWTINIGLKFEAVEASRSQLFEGELSESAGRNDSKQNNPGTTQKVSQNM